MCFFIFNFEQIVFTSKKVLFIGLFTLLVKFLCMPFKIYRYKKRTSKQLFKNFRTKEALTPIFYENIKKTLHIGRFPTEAYLWFFDLTLIFLLIKSIKASPIDSLHSHSLFISNIYLLILFCIEYLDNKSAKDILTFFTIDNLVKLIIILILYYTALSTSVEITIYWCFASILNFEINHLIKKRYFNRCEEEFNFIIKTQLKKQGGTNPCILLPLKNYEEC